MDMNTIPKDILMKLPYEFRCPANDSDDLGILMEETLVGYDVVYRWNYNYLTKRDRDIG